MLKCLILHTRFLEADGFLKMAIEMLHLVLFVAIKIMCLGFKIRTDTVFVILLTAKLGISKIETGNGFRW